MNPSRSLAAAQALYEAHERREPFTPLPPELAPRSAEEAYLVQDDFVSSGDARTTECPARLNAFTRLRTWIEPPRFPRTGMPRSEQT